LSPATTLPCLLFVIAIIAAAAGVARRHPVTSFGVLFFFASHALESTLFGLELMFEHRNYLGLSGVVIAVLGLLADLRVRPVRIAGGVAVLCVLLVFVSWNRTATWENSHSLYMFAYAAHPESGRVNLYHANAKASQGQYDSAREFLGRIPVSAGRDLHGLLLDCIEHGKLDDNRVKNAVRSPGVIDGHTTSSASLLVGQLASGQCTADLARVEQLLDRVLSGAARSPRDRRTMLMAKSWLQEQRGDVDASLDSLARAQSLSNLDALPTYDSVATLIRVGRLEAAQDTLLAALDIDRTARAAYPGVAVRLAREVGGALEAAGAADAALAWYERVSRALPDQAAIPAQELRLLVDLGREDEARSLLAGLCTIAVNERFEIDHVLRAAERKLDTACGSTANGEH